MTPGLRRFSFLIFDFELIGESIVSLVVFLMIGLVSVKGNWILNTETESLLCQSFFISFFLFFFIFSQVRSDEFQF